MTKEELKRKQYDTWNKYYQKHKSEINARRKKVREGYKNKLSVAEKRIEDLEKENAELKLKLKTAYRKGMRHMAKALKDYDRTDGAWTDYFEHTVDKVLQREQLDFEEYGTLADQLTKAKELLKEFVHHYKAKTIYIGNMQDLLEKAEQFLNSEVEKC